MHKFHIVYRTTRIDTGEFYVGVHSTNNLEDGYLGSGNRLRASVRKHGVDKFIREVLCKCDTRHEALQAEKRLVTYELMSNPLCLNLVVGGKGTVNGYRPGEGYWKGKVMPASRRLQTSSTLRKLWKERHMSGIYNYNKGRPLDSKRKAIFKANAGANKGVAMTAEQKLKLRESNISRSKPISIDGVVYDSIQEVCRAFKTRRSAVQWKLQSPKWNWHYVTTTEGGL